MCGVVGHIGSVTSMIDKLVYESNVRGLHNTGKKEFPGAGVYHQRYCTSGETNQPLHVDNRWLVFNGVINMGTKEEMEKEYGIEMETDNDGEVILRLCKTPQEAVKFLRDPKITFAGLWIEDGLLTAIRNEGRPLWMTKSFYNPIIASTADIFKRSGFQLGTIEPLEPFKIYQWTF